MNFEGKSPNISTSAFVAKQAMLIGDVVIADDASVWFGAVLRADTNQIVVGARSNVQDLCVLHVDAGHALVIGEDVTVGHRAIIHGCTIGNRVLVGMGSIVMNGARIEDDALVASGSVVTEGAVIPRRMLALGVPAKVKRELTDKEVASILENARHYARLAKRYVVS